MKTIGLFLVLMLMSIIGMSQTVTYGGVTYHTVQVGPQLWLKENINYGTRINGTQTQTNNGVVEKYCQQDNESNCTIYGGLYNWCEAVQWLNNPTFTTNWNPIPTGNVKGVCPAGWHIPSDDEWTTLMTTLGGLSVTGGKIKEAGYDHWNAPNKDATNSSFFTSLGSGDRWTDGTYHNLKQYGSYWTITGGYDGGVTSMWYGGASFATQNCTHGQYYKTNSTGVRCIKDTSPSTIHTIIDIVIPSSIFESYVATQTITVKSLVVQSNGSVALSSGGNIIMKPGDNRSIWRKFNR